MTPPALGGRMLGRLAACLSPPDDMLSTSLLSAVGWDLFVLQQKAAQK